MLFKVAFFFTLFIPLAAGKGIPLAEAAEKFIKGISAGGVVTAEMTTEGTRFSQAGELAPSGVPAEKRLFEIGSISKVFTGLLLTQAVLENKVTLDTPIAAILDDLSFQDPRVGQITLRQLASHTSGLPRLPANLHKDWNPLDPYAHYSRVHLNEALATLQLDTASPQEWSYSNFAVGLLGDALSRLYGQSWEELVREKITGPLNMPDTVVTLSTDQRKRLAPPYSDDEKLAHWNFQALAGAGALRSTAADMITFGKALLHPEKTPLEESLKLLINSRSADGQAGLSLFHYSRYDEMIMGHDGATGGYKALLEVAPVSQSVQIVFTNNSIVNIAQIIDTSKRGQVLSNSNKDRAARVLPAEQLAEYPGVYLIEAGVLKGAKFLIAQRGDELWAKFGEQQYFRYYAAQKADCFFLKEVEAELQFGREDGQVTLLTLLQGGQRYRAHKTDEALPKGEGVPLTLSKEEAAEYLGSYQLTAGFKFKITYANGALMARLTGQPSLRIVREEKDNFVYEIVAASLTFERDEQGEIIALKLHQNGVIQHAVKK